MGSGRLEGEVGINKYWSWEGQKGINIPLGGNVGFEGTIQSVETMAYFIQNGTFIDRPSSVRCVCS
jgi:hypothetical protein